MNKIVLGIAAASQGTATTDSSSMMEGRFVFADSFVGFDGHFPEHPILPAIVEIMTVVSLVSERSGCGQRLVSVEDAKFLTPVRPNQELLVQCRQRTIKGKLLYDAKLSVGEATTATMLLDLASYGDKP